MIRMMVKIKSMIEEQEVVRLRLCEGNIDEEKHGKEVYEKQENSSR